LASTALTPPTAKTTTKSKIIPKTLRIPLELKILYSQNVNYFNTYPALEGIS
jgi:hypothetical protein